MARVESTVRNPPQLQDSAELIIEAKSNMHRQRLLQPTHDYQINELPASSAAPSASGTSGATAPGERERDRDRDRDRDRERDRDRDRERDREAGGGGKEEGAQHAKPRGGLKKVRTPHGASLADRHEHLTPPAPRRTQTYSIKERRSEAPRLSKIRLARDPPIITTTAATPQDSPSTTLEPGMSFRQWGDMEVSANNILIRSGSPA